MTGDGQFDEEELHYLEIACRFYVTVVEELTHKSKHPQTPLQ